MRNLFNQLISKLRGPKGPKGDIGYCGPMGMTGAPGVTCHERIKFLRMGPAGFGQEDANVVDAVERYINLVRPVNLVSVKRSTAEEHKDGNYVVATYQDNLGYATILINLDTFHAHS